MRQWDEKHDMLLHVARELFSRFGFKKTTLEDIAEQAGLAKSTVYYYFDCKEEVFSAVIAYERSMLLDALEAAIQPAVRPEDQFSAFVKTRFQHFSNLRNLNKVSQDVMHEMLPLVRAERDCFRDRERTLLAGIIQRGVECGDFRPCDADLLAWMIIESLRGMTESLEPQGTADRIITGMDGLFDLFLNGLKASGGACS